MKGRGFPGKLNIDEAWTARSAEGLGLGGGLISAPLFDAASWFTVDLPCTSLDALVRNGRAADPYLGLGFKELPGYIAVNQDASRYQEEIHNFSDLPMPEGSPFAGPWWFRRGFELGPAEPGARLFLLLGGINHSATLWVNGRRAAGRTALVGGQRRFEIEISQLVREGQNALALEIFPPEPDDLAFTFADWNPLPPDKCMGIWQPVSLVLSGPVRLRHSSVRCELETNGPAKAELFFETELGNGSEASLEGELALELEGSVLTMRLALGPGERRRIRLSGSDWPALSLASPRLWWPYQMGAQELYSLRASFSVAGSVSDAEDLVFGVRKLESRIKEDGARLFTVNGEDLLVRGAGWAPDLMLRSSPGRDQTAVAYAKNMGLNAIRLEGNLAGDAFWELCDREGILVISGWPCCCHWERWKFWKAEDFDIAAASLEDQLLRLRNHPSLMAWFYGSDRCPPARLELRYLALLDELAPGLSRLSSATAAASPVSGPTGVKMSGPYAYVPPGYWYDDSLPGAARGFNTETGPGIAIMPLESLDETLPPGQSFPGSEAWNLHLGLGVFSTTALSDRAIELRYGKAADLADYCHKARLLQYEAWRAMFEAYARNFPSGSGLIAWMLNDSWPGQVFHLYDWFLRPGGGFYAAQKACELRHAQYSYDDGSVWAINRDRREWREARIAARLHSLGGAKLFETEAKLTVGGYSGREAFRLPPLAAGEYRLLDIEYGGAGAGAGHNSYWLSGSKDVFSDVHTFYHTALLSHADMKPFGSLAATELRLSASLAAEGEGIRVEALVENTGPGPALLVELLLLDRATSRPVLPILWEENMVCILPGEGRSLVGRSMAGMARHDGLALRAQATNSPPVLVPLGSGQQGED